ncbi:MAG: YybH family protein [Bacteroides sp.]
MNKQTISETIIALEKTAMQAWLNGNPSPFLNLYSKDFSYFDPSQEFRLDGWEKIKELYESMKGTTRVDKFEMINPNVQVSDSMAVLSYNLHIYLGQTIWKENCTEVYRLEDNRWRIIHSHISPTQPKL